MKVGYARISTKTQNLAMQLEALEREGCRPIFHEVVSGVKKQRSEWEKCKAMLRSGDTLVVWAIDRIGRSMREEINTVYELYGMGVTIKSISQYVDSSTVEGQRQIKMYIWQADAERSRMLERSRSGMESARKRGVHGGRRYKHNFNTREEVRERYKTGWTYRELKERYNICYATIYNYIKEKEQK